MTEQLHFSALWPHWPELLAGLWVTIQLTVLATIGGLTIGIFGAAIRSGRPTWFSRIWGGYVELIRNTPFVVQLFFIVFGLPNLGLKMTAGEPRCWRWWSTLGPTVPRSCAPGFR
jgi:polar amino acid transport system permease protein